jgi:multidrug efflux pump subunit AcrB
VDVDRERAASYNLSVSEIARTALIGIKGLVATTYKEGGQEVDVRVQLRPEDRANMDSVRRLVVQTRSGVMVPLSEVGRH